MLFLCLQLYVYVNAFNFFLLIVLGLKRPTPIQVNCIPKILSGSDCIGAAKTGYFNNLSFDPRTN